MTTQETAETVSTGAQPQVPQQKPLNFVLVICKTRKKFDKFVKINKIKNKYIIDIKKMLDEDGLTPAQASQSSVFKLNLLKKFYLAKDKKKHIYYIPNVMQQTQMSKLFNIKELIADTHNFTLLYFYDDFEKDKQPTDILNRLEEFDLAQMLEDY